MSDFVAIAANARKSRADLHGARATGLYLTPLLGGLPQDARDSPGKRIPIAVRRADPAEVAALALHFAANPMNIASVLRPVGATRTAPG